MLAIPIQACEVCGAISRGFGAVCAECSAGERDKHVSLRLRFLLPEGQEAMVEELRAGFSELAAQKPQGTLYSGCAVHDSELLVRAGFENADSLLSFFKSVKAPFEKGVRAAGHDNFGIFVVGLQDELAQLHEAMGALGTEFFVLEDTSRWYNRGAPGPDQHLTLAPFFTVPKGRLDEFVALFGKFYEGSRQATKERLYYGFAVLNQTVFCRQGYKNAEGVLAHLRDVNSTLQEALEIVGPDGMDLSVVGPIEELEKLRAALGHLTPKFYELEEGAEWLAK